MKARVAVAFRKIVLPMASACALILCSVHPALAWTHNNTLFDSGGTTVCGGSQSLPCLYWQQPHNTSVHISAWLEPSLQGTPYDWSSTLNGTFSNFASAPAWNPYLDACTSPFGYICGNSPVTYSLGDVSDCLTYASTVWPYGQPFYEGGQWNAYFTEADVTFNSLLSWNSSLTWATDPSTGCVTQADGRKVAGHETGHVMGLGHTGFTALMHQGPESFWTLQTNDIQGLQNIYPGNFP